MMKFPMHIVALSSSVVTSVALAVLQDSVKTLIPWLMAITTIVVADLAAGLYKSYKLGIHISISLAGREFFGKLIVYSAIVLMLAMVDSVNGHDMPIAKVGCLMVFGLEAISIVGNLLKVRGVTLSFSAVIRLLAKRLLGFESDETADVVTEEQIESIRQRERDRWERRMPTNGYGGVKTKSRKEVKK